MKKTILVTIIILAIVLVGFGAYQVHALKVAHSTFDNYYAFRGCTQLVEKTDTYGICKTASGDTIKIVLINGAWYLEGDGPGVW